MKYLELKRINEPCEEELREAIGRVLDRGWYLQGEAVARFEREYADYIGTRCCVACGNGLDALTLMLRAAMELGRLRAGDEVLVPANTYIATILAVTECGLRAVPVEPDAETLQMDDRLVERAVTERTRAVMLVHLYGQCAYTERIGEVCRRHGLLLFEDNAQAHGCTFGSRRTGSLGLAAGHSFYPGKNLGALGDAGAVTTDDEELADVVRALGNYGSARKYVFDRRGRNSRMDEVQAAVLSVKLRRVDEVARRRRALARVYINKVANGLVRLPRLDNSVFHIFPVFSERRDELQAFFRANGVETLVHYPVPPHRQRCYAGEWSGVELPVTERICREELSLPCNEAMTDAEVLFVADVVNAFRPSTPL